MIARFKFLTYLINILGPKNKTKRNKMLLFGALDPSLSTPRQLPTKPFVFDKQIGQADLTKYYPSRHLSVPSSPEYQPSTACCSPGYESPIAQDALFANLDKRVSQYFNPIVIDEFCLPRRHPFYRDCCLGADRYPAPSAVSACEKSFI